MKEEWVLSAITIAFVTVLVFRSFKVLLVISMFALAVLIGIAGPGELEPDGTLRINVVKMVETVKSRLKAAASALRGGAERSEMDTLRDEIEELKSELESMIGKKE